MTERHLRDSLLNRLLAAHPPRRLPKTVGTCCVCGVKFAAPDERRAHVEEVLRVHETICPGGHRGGHVVEPFA